MTRDRLAIEVLARRDPHLATAKSKLNVLRRQLKLRRSREIEIRASNADPALQAELADVKNWIALLHRGIAVQKVAIGLARLAAWRRACAALGIAEPDSPEPTVQ
jgi:hypothetical protein